MKQAALSGFCFILVLGMELCTRDSLLLSSVPRPLLLWRVSATWASFILPPVSLDFVFLCSTCSCLSRPHTPINRRWRWSLDRNRRWWWSLALALAFGYRQGTWLLMVKHLWGGHLKPWGVSVLQACGVSSKRKLLAMVSDVIVPWPASLCPALSRPVNEHTKWLALSWFSQKQTSKGEGTAKSNYRRM